jgi:hypothetical protein
LDLLTGFGGGEWFALDLVHHSVLRILVAVIVMSGNSLPALVLLALDVSLAGFALGASSVDLRV